MSEIKSIQQANALSNFNPTLNTEPVYLLSINQNKKVLLFISIGKPVYTAATIEVKGHYVVAGESEVRVNYPEIVAQLNKEQRMSMTYPLNNLNYVQSLNYKAK